MHGIRPQIAKQTAFWLLLGSLCGSISCSQEKSKEDATASKSVSEQDRDVGRILGSLSVAIAKVAEIPGTCADNYSSCDNTNSCPQGPCTIIVDINGSSATATVQGKNPGTSQQPYICMQSGTNVTWMAAKAGQQFSGDFGAYSPWTSGRAYVAGNSITAGKGLDQEQASNVPAGRTACYKYDLIVCPTVCAGANCNLQCGIHDPTVIIGGDPPKK